MVLFMRAINVGSFLLAALSGVLAALAMETKYTAFLAPALMALYAVVEPGLLTTKVSSGRKPREEVAPTPGLRQPLAIRLCCWAVSALVAAGLFAGWESFVAWRYGQSHFLIALDQAGPSDPLQKLANLGWPVLTVLGGIAWPLAVLVVASLRLPHLVVLLSMVVALVGYGLVGGLGDGFRDAWHEDARVQAIVHVLGYFDPEDAIYGVQGLAIAALLAAATGESHLPLWLRRGAWWRPAAGVVSIPLVAARDRGLLGLSPFPAYCAHVFGIFLIGTLLTGRLRLATAGSER